MSTLKLLFRDICFFYVEIIFGRPESVYDDEYIDDENSEIIDFMKTKNQSESEKKEFPVMHTPQKKMREEDEDDKNRQETSDCVLLDEVQPHDPRKTQHRPVPTSYHPDSPSSSVNFWRNELRMQKRRLEKADEIIEQQRRRIEKLSANLENQESEAIKELTTQIDELEEECDSLEEERNQIEGDLQATINEQKEIMASQKEQFDFKFDNLRKDHDEKYNVLVEERDRLRADNKKLRDKLDKELKSEEILINDNDMKVKEMEVLKMRIFELEESIKKLSKEKESSEKEDGKEKESTEESSEDSFVTLEKHQELINSFEKKLNSKNVEIREKNEEISMLKNELIKIQLSVSAKKYSEEELNERILAVKKKSAKDLKELESRYRAVNDSVRGKFEKLKKGATGIDKKNRKKIVELSEKLELKNKEIENLRLHVTNQEIGELLNQISIFKEQVRSYQNKEKIWEEEKTRFLNIEKKYKLILIQCNSEKSKNEKIMKEQTEDRSKIKFFEKQVEDMKKKENSWKMEKKVLLKFVHRTQPESPSTPVKGSSGNGNSNVTKKTRSSGPASPSTGNRFKSLFAKNIQKNEDGNRSPVLTPNSKKVLDNIFNQKD